MILCVLRISLISAMASPLSSIKTNYTHFLFKTASASTSSFTNPQKRSDPGVELKDYTLRKTTNHVDECNREHKRPQTRSRTHWIERA
jgi:hypothetical protein